MNPPPTSPPTALSTPPRPSPRGRRSGLRARTATQPPARAKGTYSPARIAESAPARPTPLFRLRSGGSLNYHRLRLARDAGGAVRIVDVDVFISGEPLSKTLRRPLIPALVATGNGKA